MDHSCDNESLHYIDVRLCDSTKSNTVTDALQEKEWKVMKKLNRH